MLDPARFTAIEDGCTQVARVQEELEQRWRSAPQGTGRLPCAEYETWRCETAERCADLMGWRLCKQPFPLARLLSRSASYDWLPSNRRPRRRQEKQEMRQELGTSLTARLPLDHLEYFVLDRKAVGVVSHPYATVEQVLETAKRSWLRDVGLTLVPLPCRSWYRPGDTIAVLLTRLDQLPI